jgi:hypothetical protein
MEINAQDVIDSLLEQNKQLTLQVAMLQAALKEPDPDNSSSDNSD